MKIKNSLEQDEPRQIVSYYKDSQKSSCYWKLRRNKAACSQSGKWPTKSWYQKKQHKWDLQGK